MAKTRKTAAELRAENRILRDTRWVQAVTSVVNTVVRWGAAVWIASYFYRSMAALAGETTVADLGMRVLGDLRVSTALAWVLAACGAGYGTWERRVRKKTVERLTPRHRTLERQLDARRTSSGLTPRGDSPS